MSELSLSLDLVQDYQNFRCIPETHKDIFCYGPYTSIDFDHTGDMTACCHNRSVVLGTYPQDSIYDAWNSHKLKDIRKKLDNNDFSVGCFSCYQALTTHNYAASGMYSLDSFYQYLHPLDRPTVFVFEFSNKCNLECIMCGGKWSSAIRNNREKQSNYKFPYDDNFIEDVKKYLPEIRYANFVGGEPFLEPMYYKLWEAIAEINPNIQLRVTTNGTILNDEIKSIFSKLINARVLFSLDSLREDIYEAIRINASFSEVYSNLQYWLDQGSVETILVCPMIPNWRDIPDILRLCEQRQVGVYFNTVKGPLGGKIPGIHQDFSIDKPFIIPEFSLYNASSELLQEVIHYYHSFTFTPVYQKYLDCLINVLTVCLNEKNT